MSWYIGNFNNLFSHPLTGGIKIKKLPIGIQTFRDIVEGDYVYVDKTEIAFDVIQN